MQNSQANCGPTAVLNALCALGIVRSMEECELLCGCTAQDGTSPTKLLKGLKTIHELNPWAFAESREPVAIAFLECALHDGAPVIMLVDNGEHWVTAVGLLNKKVLIADGADSELVISYPIESIASRWKNTSTKRGNFYGIRI